MCPYLRPSVRSPKLYFNISLLNRVIHVTYTILKLVAASTAEAKLGAFFLNAQEPEIFQLILMELGHPQPPTLITTHGQHNNSWYSQQHHQMSKITFNGNVILLLWTVKCNNTSNSTTNPALKLLTYMNKSDHMTSTWIYHEL
jgi:hypothetical protein